MTNQKIVVATDDDVYRQLLQDILADEGYNDVLCVGHTSAYTAARCQQPAVLLLDVQGTQPVREWALLELLWHDPATAHIPVIVCSTMRQVAWQITQQVREVPYGYLEKPFQIDELVGQIGTRIGQPMAQAVGHVALKVGGE